MSWNGSDSSITTQSARNYMFGDRVFILDEIKPENCAYLIGDLTTWVLTEQNFGKRLTVVINSPGGSVDVMMAIVGLLNLARLQNIEILTFVLGLAGSAASIIAACGDERYMSSLSRHFVHFGCIYDVTTKYSEIDKVHLQNKDYAERMIELYLKSSNYKLSKDVLLNLQSDERGYLTAEDCVKYGLCDYIIENELDEKLAIESDQAEYLKGFSKFIKDKSKKNTKVTSKTKRKK